MRHVVDARSSARPSVDFAGTAKSLEAPLACTLMIPIPRFEYTDTHYVHQSSLYMTMNAHLIALMNRGCIISLSVRNRKRTEQQYIKRSESVNSCEDKVVNIED